MAKSKGIRHKEEIDFNLRLIQELMDRNNYLLGRKRFSIKDSDDDIKYLPVNYNVVCMGGGSGSKGAL